MKKLFFYMSFFISLHSASISENIVHAFKNEDITIQVIAIKELNSGLSIAIVEQVNGTQIPVFVTNDGKNIMGISEPLIFSNQNYQEVLRDIYKRVMEHNKTHIDNFILQEVKTDMWITLEGKAKSGSVYLIFDANCRYCKQEMMKIEEMLKDYHKVKILFCGLLGEDSVQKAARIYQDIAQFKQQVEKVNYLKSVFNKDFKTKKELDVSLVQEVSRLIIQAGVNGVPYIIYK